MSDCGHLEERGKPLKDAETCRRNDSPSSGATRSSDASVGGYLRIGMRIVCLITVGLFLLATTAGDEQIGETGAARVPRALILHPVSKIREAEEDGPFEWLANMIKGIMSPQKTAQPQYQQPPPMLGPIRIPGVDDEVYIKQLGSLSNMQSRVVVRVMNPQRPQMSGPMAISPVSPTYYTYQPLYQVPPTHQIPPQSAGFVPMTSPPTPTTAPWQPPQRLPHPINNYNRHMYANTYNYPPTNVHHHHQYRPMHQTYYDPYNPRYQSQNPYGTYDFDNTIPHNGRGSRYPDPRLRPNYSPVYQPFSQDQSQAYAHRPPVRAHKHGVDNATINSEEVYDNSHQESDIHYADADESKETTESKVTDKYNEIYRSDRMVPTNPTWRNRFWTKTYRTSTTTLPTTESSESDEKEKRRDSPKFSSTEIKEIVAPDLKDWKEKNDKRDKQTRRASDSRMDEEGMDMKDGTILGKGESQEFIEKRHMNIRPTEKVRVYERISSRKRNNWKPIEAKPTELHLVYSTPKDKDGSLEVSSESTTELPEKQRKKTTKGYRKPGKSNKRVRIVESVSSSVSITSSRGKGEMS